MLEVKIFWIGVVLFLDGNVEICGRCCMLIWQVESFHLSVWGSLISCRMWRLRFCNHWCEKWSSFSVGWGGEGRQMLWYSFFPKIVTVHFCRFDLRSQYSCKLIIWSSMLLILLIKIIFVVFYQDGNVINIG